ncbi:MAG: hypothetical protein L0Y44_02730 [Phycisphaerales bacterium]|nr:hypothetical protein [Phycisphaerales bacterium]MCI0629552.1 hypothetical protein [Phycisphaerales bacterium]MCI0677052.1 hypothetical protein [Phycisphaerales bacterium]
MLDRSAQHDPQLSDQLSERLAALGAQTPSERRVKRIVPWIISVIVHVGIALVALFITWTVSNRATTDDDSVLIVADFNALTYQPLTTDAPMLSDSSSSSAQAAARPLETASMLDQLPSSDAQTIDAAMAAMLGSSRASGDQQWGSLGPLSAGGSSHSVSFAGARGTNARKVVYAIDASGSMTPYLQIVLGELTRSLENLSASQSFAIVFFQRNAAIEVPPAGKLIPATAVERLRALDWIKQENVVPAGGTNPIVAIEKAMALKPDVVFLLSQDITGYGAFEVDQADLMKLLDALNPKDSQTGRRRTSIKCIQFLDADRLGTMERIAKEHGGPDGYKFLSRQELGLGGS